MCEVEGATPVGVGSRQFIFFYRHVIPLGFIRIQITIKIILKKNKNNNKSLVSIPF